MGTLDGGRDGVLVVCVLHRCMVWWVVLAFIQGTRLLAFGLSFFRPPLLTAVFRNFV